MKISDSDAECSETLVWLNFANDCGYLSKDLKLKLILEYKEVGRMLGGMMKNPEGFLP